MLPFKNRLLIEPIETNSVLVSAENKFQSAGIVRKIGWRPWYRFWKPSFVKVGDTVLFNIWGADKVEYEGKEYWFILENEDFLLGKI